MSDQKFVEEFINSHELAVLATVTSDLLPEASVMGFALADNLTIYFGTFNTSRKWVNLQKNPRVALVIGWEKGRTVQYEGTAIEIPQHEQGEVLSNYFANKPSLAKYSTSREVAIFRVKPKWVRYSDNSKDPAHVVELTFH